MFDPEVIQTLVNAGAVTLVLVAVIALVWMFRALIAPLADLVRSLIDTQASMAASVDNLSVSVTENTEVNRRLLLRTLQADDTILAELVKVDTRFDEVIDAISVHNTPGRHNPEYEEEYIRLMRP